MTKKDYELIAKALKDAKSRYLAEKLKDVPAHIRGWRNCVAAVTEALASDNPRFDRNKFHKACGYEPCP